MAIELETFAAEPPHLREMFQLLGARKPQRELAERDRELGEEQSARLAQVVEIGMADRAQLVERFEASCMDFAVARAQLSDSLGHQAHEQIVARGEIKIDSAD